MSSSDPYPLKRNQWGGYYQKGIPSSMEKKQKVADLYLALREAAKGARPSLMSVARSTGVSQRLVRKVEAEILEHGTIQPPKKRSGGRRVALTPEMEAYLLDQRRLDPNITLIVLKTQLDAKFGSLVSQATISRFFARAVPKKRKKKSAKDYAAACNTALAEPIATTPPVLQGALAQPVDVDQNMIPQHNETAQVELHVNDEHQHADATVQRKETAHVDPHEVSRGSAALPGNARSMAISYLFVHTFGNPERSMWNGDHGVMAEIKRRLGIPPSTDIRDVLEGVSDCIASGTVYDG